MQLQGTVSVLLAKVVNPNVVIPPGFSNVSSSSLQQRSQTEIDQGLQISNTYVYSHIAIYYLVGSVKTRVNYPIPACLEWILSKPEWSVYHEYTKPGWMLISLPKVIKVSLIKFSLPWMIKVIPPWLIKASLLWMIKITLLPVMMVCLPSVIKINLVSLHWMIKPVF